MNKYKIIYTDCPHYYYNTPPQGAIQYPMLKLEDLQSIPVGQIADRNCALFYWTTWPKLFEAKEVIEAWGFTYVTLGFIWVKNYRNGNLVSGLGYYTRGNTEPCLLAKRGKIHRLENATNISQVIYAPRTKHSEKPPIVRDKIVELLGDLPRIELFSRARVFGWDSLGNDLDGMDIRKSIYMINICNQIKLHDERRKL